MDDQLQIVYVVYCQGNEDNLGIFACQDLAEQFCEICADECSGVQHWWEEEQVHYSLPE